MKRILTIVCIVAAVIACSLHVAPIYGQQGMESGDKPGERHNAPASQFIDRPFLNAVSSVEDHIIRFQEQVKGFRILPETIAAQWNKLAETYSPSLLIFLIILIICISIAGEYTLRRLFFPLHDRLCNSVRNDLLSRVWHTAASICLEMSYAGTYLLISFALYIALIPHQQAPHIVASNYIIASYYIRILLFITTVLLSPRRPMLRILPYSDKVARFLFSWITFLCGLEITLVRSGIILRKLEAPGNTFLALVAVIIGSTAILLAVMIMKSRHWVADSFSNAESAHFPLSSAQGGFAKIWHIPALFLLFCITFIWEYRVLGSNQVLFGRVIVGLLAIPLFGALDIWGGKLLANLVSKTGTLNTGKPSAGENEINRSRWSFITFLKFIQVAYRILLATLMIFMLLGLWDLDIPYGRMFTSSLLVIAGIVVVSYMIWQFFTDWVDHKIKAEMPAEDEELDEGGKGGSRLGTLLILLRKFVLSLLVILAAMFILSAFGINIGPLIAGAGILGLAISFGAQSLVTDIFAGIFFLLDDAFRVGDYIDIGTAKGTVDHISLRSVRLRHHLGMVQTIPSAR